MYFISAIWLQTESAFLYDAITLIARGLRDFIRTANRTAMPDISSCGDNETWTDGFTLVNYFKSVSCIIYQHESCLFTTDYLA
jgi:hypothetical protein